MIAEEDGQAAGRQVMVTVGGVQKGDSLALQAFEKKKRPTIRVDANDSRRIILCIRNRFRGGESRAPPSQH